MSEKPQWLFDTETAKQECRVCLDKLAEQIGRLRQLVDDSDSFAADALRVSSVERMPELTGAARAAVARMQILVGIRSGTIAWRGEEPKEKTD